MSLIRKSIKGKERRYEYYLPKSEIDFATGLTMREYYEKRIAEIDMFIEMIDDYLAKSKNATESFSKEKLKLIGPKLSPSEQGLKEWMYADYPKNPKNPQALIYKSNSGVWVRSRIELAIANLLYQYGLPFRYEQRYFADGNDFYPDFTIINPKTGKTYVWEHFGYLDRKAYASTSMWKVQRLIDLGFIPGDTLLLTGESAENVVNMDSIMATLNYILNDTGNKNEIKQTA